MKRHRQDGWLVTVVALSLLLPACTTPATGTDGKRRIEAWSYVNTKIAPWWWYTLLQLDVVHKRATGINSTIAIVDTGVLPGHEDLAKILPGMATCGTKPADTSDTNGHGTQLHPPNPCHHAWPGPRRRAHPHQDRLRARDR
jgi:hypothetical protein